VKNRKLVAIAALGIFAAGNVLASPTPVATWNFNNTLAADEPLVSALTPIDPLGLNSFITDTVFGATRQVYRFDGYQTPADQAGLSINTTGLLNGGNAYSVDMIFQFEANQSSWENIFGVSNRNSDNAFYVQPNNTLQIWPTGGGPTLFTFGQYHRVSLTNDGTGHVTAYLDGIFQFDLITTSMDFSNYVVANPNRLIHFFADNLVGAGQGEFADGRVAMIRLFDGELTGTEVGQLPTTPGAVVPEPETLALVLAGLGLTGFMARRRRRQAP
jgi:hypothetical protein